MEEALELARAKDMKERMAGVERLHQLLDTVEQDRRTQVDAILLRDILSRSSTATR